MGVYDKLGDMLNEALENGKIPETKEEKTEENTIQENKMHKYTENMHITKLPDNIQEILNTLDIAYPTDWKTITIRYHEILKQLHPDTKTTIQNNKTVNKYIHYTISDLQDMYKVLDTYFNKY